MRMLVFLSICTFLILSLILSGVSPVQAGWLTGWMSGQTTSSTPSETAPVASEFNAPPGQYGGPRPVVVTAPGVWENTRTPADTAAQLGVLSDRAQAQSGLKDSILHNRVEADRAADRARKNTVTLAPVPGAVARPIVPTAPLAPLSPALPHASPQKVMPFGGSEQTGGVQAILPHLGDRRAPVAPTPRHMAGEGQQGIQPILPILRPAPLPAPVKKE